MGPQLSSQMRSPQVEIRLDFTKSSLSLNTRLCHPNSIKTSINFSPLAIKTYLPTCSLSSKLCHSKFQPRINRCRPETKDSKLQIWTQLI